ncbi:MAG: hypothetical protein JWO38_2481 [Gemmataceae bacterium]|nr:hypothetical protein [Gemmataceae bacterium]
MAKSSTPSSNGTHGNKSDAIREELAKDPKAGSKAIIAALAERGIKVTSSLVYFVKSKSHQAKRKARRVSAEEAGRSAGVSNPVELVSRVKELAREVGGLKQLRRLVDLLGE